MKEKERIILNIILEENKKIIKDFLDRIGAKKVEVYTLNSEMPATHIYTSKGIYKLMIYPDLYIQESENDKVNVLIIKTKIIPKDIFADVEKLFEIYTEFSIFVRKKLL